MPKDVTIENNWRVPNYLLQWRKKAAANRTTGLDLTIPPPLYFHFLLSLPPAVFSRQGSKSNTVTVQPRRKICALIYPPLPANAVGDKRMRDKQIAEPWLWNTLKFLKDEVKCMAADTVTHSPTFVGGKKKLDWHKAIMQLGIHR